MEFKDLQFITPANLNLLGIRDLRKLAFAFGVYGFTLYNKSELIIHIVDVVFGREAPKMEAGRGRPTSINRDRVGIITQIIEKIKSLQAVQVTDLQENMPLVASSSETYDAGTLDKEKEVSGYVDKKENSYFVRNNDLVVWTTPCLIPIELVKELNLKPGQEIKGKASLYISGHYVLFDVSEQDTCEVDFDDLSFASQTKKLILRNKSLATINDNFPLTKGGRILIEGPRSVVSEWKSEIISALNYKNLVIVSSFTPPEIVLELKQNFENCFISSFGEDDETQQQNVVLGFERAKRLAEENGEAIVVISSLISTIKAFDVGAVFSTATQKPVSENGFSKLRKACMSAHNTKSGNSVTLVAFAEYNNALQEAMVEQISEVFTTKIAAKNEQKSPAFPLDKNKSFSFNFFK